MHRGDRVLGFFSSRSNWGPIPSRSPAGECVPPGGGGGWTQSLAGEGVMGSQFGRGARQVVLEENMYIMESLVSENLRNFEHISRKHANYTL